MEAINKSLSSQSVGKAFCPVCKYEYKIDLINNINSKRSFKCAGCGTSLRYVAESITLVEVQ